ncbi:MAG: TraR/DksA family transcriptional regulator [Sphingomonadales bacterium]|nr:TraR/DksA family transcriptional regulator [Sphingomonadales bacterium]NCO49516.1 TraR/DksA family transcriptional regulator [Sphingomonadales bacterium]NCP01109.1 TraR/DksA family transcriptional regulator [Sphingomonadales bacterium]NCP25503.1 TraR/DksA family transcriptional regulator [Sphingomonadales bacterium]NCP42799.1 TraR/DksA family transcriptional regulator [Sphingomonadales bacterium]
MDSGLTSEQIDHFKQKLHERQAQLKALDAQAANWRGPVELDQQSVGRLSRMDAMQQQEMAQAEARRRVSDLARIEMARVRIAEGEYGWCAECGEPIGHKRLEIDPAAPLCIGCAR